MSREELRERLKVYFIMGSPNCKKEPTEVLKEAIEGGITLFQFREKGDGALVGVEKVALARKLQAICQESNIPFIVNDDIDLALEINADGVHIGQEDEPVEIVRKKVGNKILGVSVHNYDEAIHAIQGGADYFGLGPIYETKTKADTKAVQGIKFISELRKKGIDMPLVGIGGITQENAQRVIEAGADGVSIITAITHADSVKEATRELKTSVLRGC